MAKRVQRKKARQLAARIIQLANSDLSPVDLSELCLPDDELVGFDPDADHSAGDRDYEDELARDQLKSYWIHKLLSSWVECRFDLEKWPFLESVNSHLNQGRTLLCDGAEGPELRTFRVRPVRYPEGVHPGDGLDKEAYTSVVDEFVSFLTGPYSQSVRLCKQCKRFFLAGRKKRFCSSKCGRGFHARKHTRARYTRDREDRKTLVQQAIDELAKKSLSRLESIHSQYKSLRHWVAHYSGLSVGFVTRLLNRGEITVPKSLKGQL